MSSLNPVALWSAGIGGLSAVAAAVASRRPQNKRTDAATAEAALGHGWSEFAAALREEASEERQLRKTIEGDAEQCKARLTILERRYADLELQQVQLVCHLTDLGLDLPAHLDKRTSDDLES